MIIEISFYTGIIDENNNLVVEYNYDGYGNIISMVDNTTNKIGEKIHIDIEVTITIQKLVGIT